MAGERCEAFEYKEPDEMKLAAYYRKTASLPLVSKIMLSLYEDPVKREAQLKAHCDEVEERAALRKINSTLPMQEAEDPTKHMRKTSYMATKQNVCVTEKQICSNLPRFRFPFPPVSPSSPSPFLFHRPDDEERACG